MENCAQCGNEVRSGEVFCRHCGARLGPAPIGPGASPVTGAVTEEELAQFVGKNTDKYLSAFRKFVRNNEDSFSATWHWPAFFFTFWWLIYRKMYWWLLPFLFLGCVPYLGLFVMIGYGISGNYLYYRHAKKKIIELKSQPASDIERAAAIARMGGVNNVAVVLVPLVAVALIAILAAIAIPQFAAYRQKAADHQAKQEIQAACAIGAKIFAEQPGKTEIEPDEFLYAGLVRTPEVEMLLLDGSREAFSISAKHKKGKMLYTTDQQCYLTEEPQPAR